MVLSHEHPIIRERERERSRTQPSYGPALFNQYPTPIQPLAPTMLTPQVPHYPPPSTQVEHHTVVQYGGLTLPRPSAPLKHPTLPMTPYVPFSQDPCYTPTVPASYPQLNQTYQQLHLGPPQAWTNPYQSEVVYDQPVAPDIKQSSGSARCIVHGKIRTIQNLKKNENGEWSCASGSECRSVPSNGNEMCSIHNKKRSLQNLVKDGSGQWICDSRSTCITVSKSVFTKEICSVHGKLRSLRYLAQRTPGVYACLVDSECYVTKLPGNAPLQPILGYSLH